VYSLTAAPAAEIMSSGRILCSATTP
jgi:hypothetical protein